MRVTGAHLADMIFQRTGNAVGLDHQHRDAEGIRPAAPVGSDIAEIMGDEQWDAQIRIVVMQFECDGHFAVAMVDRPGRNAFEGAGRQSEGEGETATRKDFTQHRAAFVDGDCHIA